MTSLGPVIAVRLCPSCNGFLNAFFVLRFVSVYLRGDVLHEALKELFVDLLIDLRVTSTFILLLRANLIFDDLKGGPVVRRGLEQLEDLGLVASAKRDATRLYFGSHGVAII